MLTCIPLVIALTFSFGIILVMKFVGAYPFGLDTPTASEVASSKCSYCGAQVSSDRCPTCGAPHN